MAKIVTSRSAKSKRTTTSSSIRRAKTLSASLLRGEPVDEPGADIRRASLEEIEAMARRGELYPTARDAEEIELDESFWRNARVVMPAEGPKTSVHLRVDPDVFDWFKRQGKGHLTRMNAVLRAYYEANRKKAS
ncbi:MAG TPA: BrnA antitoxin family protein [Bauldia sp.]|nr:BrnA antitoxin family protein [Bauldia sp.]